MTSPQDMIARSSEPAPGATGETLPPASGAFGYDTRHLEDLRRELRQLNESALRSGLIALKDGQLVTPSQEPRGGARQRQRDPDRGRVEARRLLALMAPADGDDSASVAGTACTEAGVVRLLSELRKPRVDGNPFLQRLRRYLTRPVAVGIHTTAGISVERVQTVYRHLVEIETHGWDYYVARRAERRGRQSLFTAPPMAGGSSTGEMRS